MTTLTLTGYLGADREIRSTRQRTGTGSRYNPVIDDWEAYDYTTTSRSYARLSLAARKKTASGWETTWHQLVVWDADGMDRVNVRIARKGDRVRITGRPEVFTYTDEAGTERQLHRIIVDTFQLLQPKVTREAA